VKTSLSFEFSLVADDLEWLRDEWWGAEVDLSEAHIRRGSATLHLLLQQGLLGRAWRHFGFSGGEPTVLGPDLLALAVQSDVRIEMAASLIAGGGRLNGIDLSFIGAFRVDNPITGVPAEADEGFAVVTTSVVRDARIASSGDLDCLVEHPWRISEYLKSVGAVRKGNLITRGQIIDYFRNYAGGAHSDLLKKATTAKTDRHELLHDLVGHVRADIREGLHFELLSIGQALGRSNDISALISAIRSP
jgi:hypothetical protein